MHIVTKRFLLRDFVDDDGPAFLAYHANPRSLELYGPQETEPGHARHLLELFRLWATEQPRRNYQLAVIQRQGPPLLVGCCGLRTADSEMGKAELGIELAPEFWGRYGYALEVLRALADFGFSTLGLRELYSHTVSTNVGVARLARHFGAVSTIRAAPACMVDRGWAQTEWHVTREQWKSASLTQQFTLKRAMELSGRGRDERKKP